MEVNFLFFGVIFLINLVRFLGLDFSPPGFFVDEAVGAAHVLCLKQTGADYFGTSYPLFSAGFGGGFYTAPFLYGEALFTSIFGNSIFAFRAFLALVTFLTIVLIYFWTKRETNERTARFALLFATITPWAFQFSRIAWDPPLAPLFLMLGLVFFQSKKTYSWILGSLSFAIASYAYPPARIQAFLFLLLIPSLRFRKTIGSFLVWGVALIPLFLRSLDGGFTARAKMLVLWSDYPMNPYHDASIFGLTIGFCTQLLNYFTPDFLLLHGDHNLRHSIQVFGMLSYPEVFFLCGGVMLFLFRLRQKQEFIPKGERVFFIILLAGIFSGLTAGALTWEGGPHALRAIGAWPFFSILAAFFAEKLFLFLKDKGKYLSYGTLAGSAVFSIFYLNAFFTGYPVWVEPWFKTEAAPLAHAYEQMVDQGITCQNLKR